MSLNAMQEVIRLLHDIDEGHDLGAVDRLYSFFDQIRLRLYWADEVSAANRMAVATSGKERGLHVENDTAKIRKVHSNHPRNPRRNVAVFVAVHANQVT